MAKEQMTEDELLEFITAKAREISQAPNRTRRQQPRVGRVQSWRQMQALRQPSNPVKAIYEGDGKYPTPIRANEEGLTREVGPGQDLNPMWALQRQERGTSGKS